MDVVTSLTADKPVVIFSKSTCFMSHTVKALICSFGASPSVIELDKMQSGHQVERALIQLGCKPSVPAVFIGFLGRLIALVLSQYTGILFSILE